MDLSNMLVIADRNDSQQLALRAALDLAGRESPTTITLTGFAHDPLVDEPALLSESKARRLQAEMLREQSKWLEVIASRRVPPNVRVLTKTIWAKDVAAWVVENCKPSEYGLIVKAGHRSESITHTPTDWRLLREAGLPVLIARGKLRLKPGCLLATIDLGTTKPAKQSLNKKVLATAALLARQLDAQLHVCYAIPMSTVAHDLDLVDRAELESKARQRFDRVIRSLAEEFDIPVSRFRLKAGPPEEVIDGVARKVKAALVVMGTVGRRGLKAKLIGNTAERVLHANRTSVLALWPDH